MIKIAFLVQNLTLKFTKEVYFLLGHPVHVRNIILDKGEITLYKEFLFMIFRQLTALLDHGSFLTVEN